MAIPGGSSYGGPLMQIQYVLRSYGYQTAAYSIPRVACAPVSPADSAVSPRPREEETQKKQRGRVLFGIPFVFGSKMKMKQSKNAKNFTVHSKQTISISDHPLMVLCTVYCRAAAVLHCAEIMQNYGAAFSSEFPLFWDQK